MSGGSLDYVYQRVEEAASMIESRAETPEQRAFAAHLRNVAKALHDIEWVFSCDYGRGDDTKAIMECINRADVIATAAERACVARDELTALLSQACLSGHDFRPAPLTESGERTIGRTCFRCGAREVFTTNSAEAK